MDEWQVNICPLLGVIHYTANMSPDVEVRKYCVAGVVLDHCGEEISIYKSDHAPTLAYVHNPWAVTDMAGISFRDRVRASDLLDLGVEPPSLYGANCPNQRQPTDQ